jgi:hypothetical protein
MPNDKPFLSQTHQTALFALREYFRPLIVAAVFLKSKLASAKLADSTEESPHAKDVPQKGGQREFGEARVSEEE